MKARIKNEGKSSISAWGSDSGGVTISPGSEGVVSGKEISMSGSDNDGEKDVGRAHAPGDFTGNPGSD